MSRRLYGIALGSFLAMGTGLLSAPVPAPKDARSLREIEAAKDDLRQLQHRAADPKTSAAELWKLWQEFRLRHSGEPEYRQAAEVMGKASSPLDGLDRQQIPAEDRPSWLPEKVVAVLGENRGRDWSAVRSVSVSPDGKLVASCTLGAVRVWDTVTMRERTVLQAEGKLRSPLAATFSPDGHLLAVGYEKGMVLWDISTARPKQKGIDQYAWFTFSLHFVRGGQALLYVGNGLRIWDVNAEAPRQQTHPKVARSAIVSPNGRWLLAYGPQEEPGLWDLNKPDPVAMPLEDAVGSFAFSADSKTLVGLTRTREIMHLWDVGGVKPQQRDNDLVYPDKIEGRDRSPIAVALAPDGKALAHLFHGQLSLWPLNDTKRKELGLALGRTHRRIQLPFDIESLVYTPDGKMLVLGGADGTVRLWDIASSKVKFPLLGHAGAVFAIAFAPDCRALVSTGMDSTMRWWDLQGRKSAEPHLLTDRYSGGGFAFAPQGRYLASLGGSGIPLWELSGEGNIVRIKEKKFIEGPFNGNKGLVGIAFSPNGRLLAAIGTERDAQNPAVDMPKIHLWEFKDGTFKEGGSVTQPATEAEISKHPDEPPYPPLFLDDSKHLLFAAWNRWRIWDLKAQSTQDGPQVNCPVSPNETFSGGGGRVSALEGVPDRQSKPLEYSFFVRIWDVTAKGFKNCSRLSFSGDFPVKLRFSLDGRKMASIDNTDHLAVWDIVSGRKEYEIALPGRVLMMAFAPDGRHLATANANGTTYIYRLAGPAKSEKK